jgi:hypothetical protein
LVGHPSHLRFRTGWERVKRRRRLRANRLTSLLEWHVSSCYLLLSSGVLTLGMLVMALVVVSFSTARIHMNSADNGPDISPDVPTTSTCPRPGYWNRGSCSGGYTFVVLIKLWSVYNRGRIYPLKGLVSYLGNVGALRVIRPSNIEPLTRLPDVSIYEFIVRPAYQLLLLRQCCLPLSGVWSWSSAFVTFKCYGTSE